MIKRTIFFSKPAYLSTKNEQLLISFPENSREEVSMPIEDLGFLVLEHPQITLTNGLIMKLIQNKTAILTCDQQHLPCSILQPLVGHSQQSETSRYQMEASQPLKKQLWQQTVMAKVDNQRQHLENKGKNAKRLKRYVDEIKSGDTGNIEALAAAYYFQHLFEIENFSRNQKDLAPNNLLNYGYAILRAICARAIVSSGLLPTLGIFHSNKYNAFCLADDLMEPYRPMVDDLVYDIVQSTTEIEVLTKDLKSELLRIPALNVMIDNKVSPLMNAMSRTTNSLVDCYKGKRRKLLYPSLC